jgi:GMT-like wHTH domain
MQPKTTIWDLEPHTAAKHEILRRYLQAWAPILSQGNFPQLVFVDGFAGPGRYSKGEEGSPLIAVKAAVEQPRPIRAQVDFHFIELDEKGPATDYFLFFATNNELGLKKIKEAMWRVDESGKYTFSDATDPNQSMLFAAEPNRDMLKRLILEGIEAMLSDIERFVVRDTPFRETHYKKVLQSLEAEGKIEPVDPRPTRRRGTYADMNMRLRFRPSK